MHRARCEKAMIFGLGGLGSTLRVGAAFGLLSGPELDVAEG